MQFVRRASLNLSAGILVASCATGGNTNSPGSQDSTGSSDGGVVEVDAGGAAPALASHQPATTSDGDASAAPATSGANALGFDASAGAEAADGSFVVMAETADGSPLPTGVSPAADGSAAAPGASVTGNPAAPDGSSGALPTVGGCAIFPADNPWNTRVDDPQAYPVHPNSATFIASMSPTTHLHPDWSDWSTNGYGIPWETVPGSQPMVPMTFDVSDESDPGPYPFPPTARVEGGSNSGGDMHVLVIDTGTCTLYETYSSTYVGPGWQCSSGAKFNLGSNALRPDGWTSADAAGLPIFPGLVRVSEVQAGAIHHALRFTMDSTQQGYIHPATHAAGTNDASLPPMGLRLRLKASFDVSKFTGPAAVILTAMQQYGVILADNGSNWFVSGDSDDAWTPLMDGVTQAFSQVTGSDFEAVQTGPILQ